MSATRPGGTSCEHVLVLRVAEAGREDVELDDVVLAEQTDGVVDRLLREIELGARAWFFGSAASPIEPDTSSTSATRAFLRCVDHSSSSLVSTAGCGTSSSVCGWFGSTPLAATIGSPMATAGLPGRKWYDEHLSLVVGLLHEVLEDLRRVLLLLRDPRRVEDEVAGCR